MNDTIFDLISMLVFGFVVISIISYLFVSAFKSECSQWNGTYHWSTGCIIEYRDKKLTLNDYKEVIKFELLKPVPTNVNVNLGAQ